MLATTSGIEVSTDGGATWTAAQGTLPPGGFSYVGMTTPDQGVAVPADAAVHAVWFTVDGGADLAGIAASMGRGRPTGR